MRPMLRVLMACGFMLLTPLVANAKGEPVSSAADPDFAVQGEYVGTATDPDSGNDVKVGAQIIALGDGKFRAVGTMGGLPGEGGDLDSQTTIDGERQGSVVVFDSGNVKANVKNGVIQVVDGDGKVVIELKKLERKSPTLGAKPPAGAVVLFDGSSAAQFDPGRRTDEGLLMAGATSKRKFQSCQLHVEFQLPFMPTARGQGRGNSGCYLQGRYEVQMLDSFGLEGADNECGAIYGIKAPDVNMCFPPLSWQTYDIDYTAAQFDGGKKVKNATITVRHNGTLIHDKVELPNATRAAPLAEGPEPGPVYLQDHGNPVRYRNIWIVERP